MAGRAHFYLKNKKNNEKTCTFFNNLFLRKTEGFKKSIFFHLNKKNHYFCFLHLNTLFYENGYLYAKLWKIMFLKIFSFTILFLKNVLCIGNQTTTSAVYEKTVWVRVPVRARVQDRFLINCTSGSLISGKPND